jgi:RNA polymerase sigma-B factor
MSTYRTLQAAPEPLEDLDEVAVRYAQDRRLLPPEQHARLRDQLITSMLPFAGRLARRYRSAGEPPEDLEQVARLGLVKAVDRYDPERGSFTAFAVTTISGSLKRHFRDHTWGVHVPRRVQELTLAVVHAENALTAELGRRPAAHEVAERCGVDATEVMGARRSSAGYRPISLSVPVGETGDQMGDLFGDADPAVEAVADQQTVRRLISQLPPREQRILLERFYGNRTQADIAADLGVSQMHVSRLLSRTLAWLRAAMLSDEPPPWQGGAPDVDQVDPLVTVRLQPSGALRVLVTGEVDRDNADRLRQALLRLLGHGAAPRIEIDLRGVPFLDAAAVSVLLSVHEAARVRSVVVTVTGLQPAVRRIATVAGLGALLSDADRRGD